MNVTMSLPDIQAADPNLRPERIRTFRGLSLSIISAQVCDMTASGYS